MEGRKVGGSLIPHTLHFSAPFHRKTQELSLPSTQASTSAPVFPPLPSPAGLPSQPLHRTALIELPRNLCFARPGGHSLTQLPASSFEKHFMSGPPGLGLSWLSSHAFLPSQHLRPHGSPGLPALSCLLTPWLVSAGHMAFHPSQPCPRSLPSPSSLRVPAAMSGGLWVTSACSADRTVQNRILHSHPPNDVSLGLDCFSLTPRPRPQQTQSA